MPQKKQPEKIIIVYVTCPDNASSLKIANVLLENKLAACINIIPGVRSIYKWKGKVETANEFLLMIKTKSKLFSKVEKAVSTTHPYDTPEVISVAISNCSEKYKKWITDSL